MVPWARTGSAVEGLGRGEEAAGDVNGYEMVSTAGGWRFLRSLNMPGNQPEFRRHKRHAYVGRRPVSRYAHRCLVMLVVIDRQASRQMLSLFFKLHFLHRS